MALLWAGCAGGSAERPATRPPGSIIRLPEPRRAGDASLEEVLAARRSVRSFTDQPVTLAEISQLLWAAQGITSSWGGRTAPSAGALYPLEVYGVTADMTLRYIPDGHRAELLSVGDPRRGLAAAAFGQGAVVSAPVVLVLAAVFPRTEVKYGARAERYVKLEGGHAAQNVLLQAVALGLGAVPIGSFEDDGVRQALDLADPEQPLYLIPIGHPAEEP
jgi:SagB-type dehydrogenase family enzyme